MSPLMQLIVCTGDWHGTNLLQDPMNKILERSVGTATITPLLGDKFVRLDYTWHYQDNSQEGSMVFGYEADAKLITAYWIDSWHMADKGMLCKGYPPVDNAPVDNALSVQGTYDVGEGPDWGWRIVITSTSEEIMRIIMYNIDPAGQEELAVEADYTRS